MEGRRSERGMREGESVKGGRECKGRNRKKEVTREGGREGTG